MISEAMVRGVRGNRRILEGLSGTTEFRTPNKPQQNVVKFTLVEPLCQLGLVFWPKDCIILSSFVLLWVRMMCRVWRRREEEKGKEEKRKNKEKQRDF